MILDATTKKIQVVFAGAKATNDCPVTTDWVDITTSTYTPGCTEINTNGVTAVDVVAAPAASTQRVVKYFSLYNADTAPVVASVLYNNNSTTYVMVKATLQVGDTLIFTDPNGWKVQDATGQQKNTSVLSNITVVAGKSETFNNTLTFVGTDGTTITFQATDTYVGRATTDTLTNKRITPRVVTQTNSSGTPTIDSGITDLFSITGQTADITSMTSGLSGSPTSGQKLIFQITGTASRAITWGTSYEASGSVALPATTSGTTILSVGFIWNAATNKWTCVAVA